MKKQTCIVPSQEFLQHVFRLIPFDIDSLQDRNDILE